MQWLLFAAEEAAGSVLNNGFANTAVLIAAITAQWLYQVQRDKARDKAHEQLTAFVQTEFLDVVKGNQAAMTATSAALNAITAELQMHRPDQHEEQQPKHPARRLRGPHGERE